MNKQGKIYIIALSTLISVVATVKMVSDPGPKVEKAEENNPKTVKTASHVPEVVTPENKPDGKFVAQTTDQPATEHETGHKLSPQKHLLLDKLIKKGMDKIGTPYVFGGRTERGFDCSGFVHYVFGRFDIAVPHSSRMLAEVGKRVNRKETRKGDILIFTGTNSAVRSPGHVGIVISKLGDPVIKFVHSSSNGGVKISQVEGTNYERRFLEIRRVL